MPFKIVQTFERGRTFLSCVPSSWEKDKLLLWPKNGSKKLQKNEYSIPSEDWISQPCQLKRSDLTYEEAQMELIIMQRESDTDDGFQRKQFVNTTGSLSDLNDIALQCIAEKENILSLSNLDKDFPTTVQQPEEVNILSLSNLNVDIPTTNQQSEEVNILSLSNLNVDIPTTNQQSEEVNILSLSNLNVDIPTTNQQSEEVNIVAEDQNNTFLLIDTNFVDNPKPKNTAEERLERIEKLQENILNKLSTVEIKIEHFIWKIQQDKLTTNLGFQPIDDILSLQKLDDALKQKDYLYSLKEKLSLVCGSGKGRGLNNCYALIDVMFTRRFLTECSWAGGSKSIESKKHCFKAYSQVISLFFEVILHSDKSFTLLECETFLKNILKNSGRRNLAKMMRASATKTREKGKGKKFTPSAAVSQPISIPSNTLAETPPQSDEITMDQPGPSHSTA